MVQKIKHVAFLQQSITIPRHPNTSWEGIWTPKTYLKHQTSGDMTGCLGHYHIPFTWGNSRMSSQLLRPFPDDAVGWGAHLNKTLLRFGILSWIGWRIPFKDPWDDMCIYLSTKINHKNQLNVGTYTVRPMGIRHGICWRMIDMGSL